MNKAEAIAFAAKLEEAEKISKQIHDQVMACVKNPVIFTTPIDIQEDVWGRETREDVWEYFRLDCCSPGTDQAMEDAYFMDYVSMYHYWRASVSDDKAIAADEGDTGRDPYNYIAYHIKATPEERYGKLYIVEHEYPVKVYKRHGKIFCKYK